jgi:hypothetical protein
VNTTTLDETTETSKGRYNLMTLRGIRFQTEQNNHIGLIDIFSPLHAESYYWHLDNVSIMSSDGAALEFNQPGFSEGQEILNEFNKGKLFAIFGEFIAFKDKGIEQEIKTWEDFNNSSAQIVILIVDAYYFDIYLKDQKLLDEYYQHILRLGYKPELIDENDDR